MTDSLKHRFFLQHTYGNSTTVQHRQLLGRCSKACFYSVAMKLWLLKTHMLSASKPKIKLSQQDSPLVHILCFAVNICKHTEFMTGGNSFKQFPITILASSIDCDNTSLRVWIRRKIMILDLAWLDALINDNCKRVYIIEMLSNCRLTCEWL